jgi:hypothetical protein
MVLLSGSFGGDMRLVAVMQYLRVVVVAITASLVLLTPMVEPGNSSARRLVCPIEHADAPTRMMPYRTAAPRSPEMVDVEVMRFIASAHRARCAQLAIFLGAVFLAVAASFAPLALSLCKANNGLVSTRMNAAAPFDSTPRRLPAVHAIVTAYCTFWGDDEVDTAARVQYELDHWVTCRNGCIPFPEPSPWE